jgi:hypothetical protein
MNTRVIIRPENASVYNQSEQLSVGYISFTSIDMIPNNSVVLANSS